jgi:hypothetical protein
VFPHEKHCPYAGDRRRCGLAAQRPPERPPSGCTERPSRETSDVSASTPPGSARKPNAEPLVRWRVGSHRSRAGALRGDHHVAPRSATRGSILKRPVRPHRPISSIALACPAYRGKLTATRRPPAPLDVRRIISRAGRARRRSDVCPVHRAGGGGRHRPDLPGRSRAAAGKSEGRCPGDPRDCPPLRADELLGRDVVVPLRRLRAAILDRGARERHHGGGRRSGCRTHCIRSFPIHPEAAARRWHLRRGGRGRARGHLGARLLGHRPSMGEPHPYGGGRPPLRPRRGLLSLHPAVPGAGSLAARRRGSDPRARRRGGGHDAAAGGQQLGGTQAASVARRTAADRACSPPRAT